MSRNPKALVPGLGRVDERAFSAGSAEVRYSFAGRRAQTAQMPALSDALMRVGAGDDAQAVRKETGWFVGADGKMRFEISDEDAKLKPQDKWKEEEENKRRAVFFAEQELYAAKKEKGPRLRAAKKALEKAQIELNTETMSGLTVGKMLEHPKLFEAYPAIAGVRVTFDRMMPPGNARYTERGFCGDPEITIGLKDQSCDEILSVLLHEIQHAIQDFEGFASGGMPEDFKRVDICDLRLQNAKYAEAMKSYLRKKRDEGVSFRDATADGYGEILSKSLAQLQDAIRGYDNPIEAYRRLAGEVEARNVEARQKMTQAERLETAPSATADVAEQDLILVFNGKEAAAAANASSKGTMHADGVERQGLDSDGHLIHSLERMR